MGRLIPMNYKKTYNQIVQRAKNRIIAGYVEKHHIIPRCMGGNDNKENIVKLTSKEHFLSHKLLCEIYPNDTKLKLALCFMTYGKGNSKQKRTYITSLSEYERARKNFSKSISLLTKGVNKSKEHCESMRVPKSVPSSSKGKINRWNEIQLKNNKKNQPGIRSINQYNLNKEFIKKWESVTDATKIYGSGIGHCLMGRQKQTKGFLWKYSNNEVPNKRIGGKNKKNLL